MNAQGFDDLAPKVVAFSFLFVGILVAMHSCGCSPPPPADATCLRAFREELLACVRNAKTLDESHACRDEVELRWGYPHE